MTDALKALPAKWRAYAVRSSSSLASEAHESDAAELEAALADRCSVAREAIYVASKTKYAAMWRELRYQGMPIISTWIDEAGKGETQSWADLWQRCVSESARATGFIIYGREGEVMKGALVEVGTALGAGVPVAIVGKCDGMKNASAHPLVIGEYESVEQARRELKKHGAFPEQPAGGEAVCGG